MSRKDRLGDESYDEHDFGTVWWLERALNPAHRKAYKTIVEFASEFITGDPRHIIDYASGPGLLLRELLPAFPNSFITAIDESAGAIEAIPAVLKQAKMNPLEPRLLPLRTALPNFDTGLPKADVVFFLFPDFRGGLTPSIMKYWQKTFPKDWECTKALRKHLKKHRPEWSYDPNPSKELFYKRMAMRNHHAMVTKGGIVVRVDYAQCHRHEVDPTMLQEMAWIEGCQKLPRGVASDHRKGHRPFELIGSSYIKAKAIMKDVYAQTEDPDDLHGGYIISVLKAR